MILVEGRAAYRIEPITSTITQLEIAVSQGQLSQCYFYQCLDSFSETPDFAWVMPSQNPGFQKNCSN